MERDNERLPRPASQDFMDLERRGPIIPRGYVKPYMLSTGAYGMEYGRYGRDRYGRCLYGARVGIYGADKYGSCVYY